MYIRSILYVCLIGSVVVAAPTTRSTMEGHSNLEAEHDAYQEGQQESDIQDIVDPETFFEDAPEEPDVDAQLSDWQIYMTRIAQKLYLFELVDYTTAAYAWMSQKMKAAVSRLWWRSRKANKDKRHAERR